MTKKEICNFALDHIEREDKKSEFVEYLAVTGKDQIIMKDEFDGGYDYRLNSEEYLNNSLTIIVKSRENGFTIGKGTIFFTDYRIYKDVFFWKRTHDRFNSLSMQFIQHGYEDIKIRLSKKNLGAYRDVIGHTCITLGFSQIANSVRLSPDIFAQYKAMTLYLNLVYKFIHECNLFVYIEPCGICRVEESLLSGDFLDINSSVIRGLGQVDPESKVSFKLAQKIGMSVIEDLYHDTTLGPILFSKIA